MRVWRDASEEFWRLLAFTRARKIREDRGATRAEVAALLELYATAMTTSFRGEAPIRDVLVAELQARPDPLAIMALPAREREQLDEALRLLDLRTLVRPEPNADEAADATESTTGPGAKSRWRRADLETIFVKQPDVSARKLATSGDLVEQIHHQRISEVRGRGDVGLDEHGHLKLPPGTTGDSGWITLPKRG